MFVMGGRWPYSCSFVWCCPHDLFKIACSILVKLPSSFFSTRFVSVHVVHPYSSIDTTGALKKLRFILSVRFNFHMTDSLSIAVHAFVSRVLMPVSIDECPPLHLGVVAIDNRNPSLFFNWFWIPVNHYKTDHASIFRKLLLLLLLLLGWWVLRGVMAKVLHPDIVVSEFELQSRYCSHFQSNILAKDMTPLYPPSSWLTSTTNVLLQGWIWY